MGDVYGHLYSGNTPSRKNSTNFGGDTPWIRTADLNNGLIKSATEFLTYEGIKQLKILPENTIVLAMYGGFNQIGRTGILGFPATINQALVALTPQKNINQVFAQSYLNRHIIDWRRVAASSRKDPNITKEDVEKSDFSFGSLEEQNRISKLISRLDHTITLHEGKKRQLERLKSALLQKMFADKSRYPAVRFEGFSDEWKTLTLSSLATMHARIGWQNLRTSEFLSHGKYMLITGTDFKNGQINFSTCHYVEKERYEQDKHIQIKNGSILITKDGTLGKVAYVQGLSKPATLNAGIFNIEIRNENEIDRTYLFQYLKAPFLMNYVQERATGGTIKHLNQSILKSFPVQVPNKIEQNKIGELIAKLDHLINLQQTKLNDIAALKNSLLQSMFI